MSLVKIKDLKPRAPFVFVRRLPAQTEFKHLMILLPDEQNFLNRKVKVVSTHKGHRAENGTTTPCDVAVGDICELTIFDAEEKFSMLDEDGKVVEIEVCRESEILAKYRKSCNRVKSSLTIGCSG